MERIEEKVSLPTAEKEASAQGVSKLALILGLVFLVLTIHIVAYAELVVKQIQIAICQFSPAALGMLLIVVVLNRAISWVIRRPLLKPSEIVVVYAMIILGAMIASRGLMEKLLPALVAVNYYANPQNKWVESFYPHIPRWMAPFDPKGLERQPVALYFYEGVKSSPIPWGEWAVPLAAWSIVVLAVFTCFLCMAALLRRQWVDNEKLTFPLTQPPLQLADPKAFRAFVGNRLAWIGFCIPALVFTLNGLHLLYPSIPEIGLQNNLNQYFRQKPWSDMTFTTVYASFAAVGFGYFLPTQLLFSLWFFYLLTRVQDVVFSMLGWEIIVMPLYPTRIYMGYQVAGSYLVLTCFMLRAALPHLKQVVRRACFAVSSPHTPLTTIDDRNELMPYPVAFWGLLIALVVAVGWAITAGLSPWVAVVEMVVYLGVVVLVMARSVSEAGLMMTETSFRPVDLLRLWMPKHRLGARNLTVLSFLDAVFTRDLRGLLLTPMMDALKISDSLRMRRRQLLLPFVLAIFAALLTAGYVELNLPYRHAALNMYSYAYWGNCLWSFQDNIASIQAYDRPPLVYMWSSFLSGCVFTLFLIHMRSHYWWWSLYPMGYALSASWTMIVFWFPVLIAWLIKSLLLRYAGMKAYTKLRPFFIGLIFGEFFMAVVWATYSMVTRKPAPFFPWP